MSRVSIFEKKWLDLVFEGKNQEYGAYQLRQESSKTTLKAFIFGIILLTIFVYALSSFSSSNVTIINPVIDGPLTVTPFHSQPKVNEPIPLKVVPQKKQPLKDVKAKDLAHPILTSVDQVVDEVATKTDPKTSNLGLENDSDMTGSTSGSSTGISEITTVFTPKSESNEAVISAILDKQPEFPGGIKKFYEYIGKNFERPETDEFEKISVYVSFVIEKDGSMSQIRVLRNPGYGLGKESIRVLNSLNTKWKPGIKDGKAVRTQYTLPITVQNLVR